MKLKGAILHPQKYFQTDVKKSSQIKDLNMEHLNAAYERHNKQSLLKSRSFYIRQNLTKVNNEQLHKLMKRRNAYFTYKQRGLLGNLSESKIEHLNSVNSEYMCEFNALKSEIVKDDLKAVKYRHEIMCYFNNPKQNLPKFLKRSLIPEQELSLYQKEEDFPRVTQKDYPKPLKRYKKNKDSQTLRNKAEISAPRQREYRGLKNYNLFKQSIANYLRKEKSIVDAQRSRNEAAQSNVTAETPKPFMNQKLMTSLRPIMSILTNTNFRKERLQKTHSSRRLASDRKELHRTQSQFIPPEKRMSLADIIHKEKQELEVQKRNDMKKQFSYAGLQSRKYEIEEYESSKKKLTDIPGINLKVNGNVKEMHNFQQYFESTTSKAKNLSKICDYRAQKSLREKKIEKKSEEEEQKSKTPKPSRCSSALLSQREKTPLKTPLRRHYSMDRSDFFRALSLRKDRTLESRLTYFTDTGSFSSIRRAQMLRSLRRGNDSPSNLSTEYHSLIATMNPNSRAVSPNKAQIL